MNTMEKSINELMCIMCEKFNLEFFEIIDLDGDEILWGSINDGYGITWNIINENIEIYFDGSKVGFLSKNNIQKGFTEIDSDFYQDLIKNMASMVKENEEIKSLINKRLQRTVLYENYEEAIVLKNFMKRL